MTLIIGFGAQGFEHGRVNNFRDQSIQLPIIHSYADPSLYPNDNLLDVRHSYVTWFYPAIGLVSRWVPLLPLMMSLYLLSIFISLSAILAIGNTLYPRQHVGVIASVLWMAYLPNLGGDYVHSPFVTHSTLAISLVLWAIWLILTRRYTSAAILLGLTANINAMTAVFVAFMWMVALATSPREWSWRWIRIPILMGLSALPILLWRLSLPLVEASLDDFVHIIRLRLWYAVFPFELSPLLWIGFIALLIGWRLSWRFGLPVQHPQILRMMGGCGLLCLLGIVFSEIIPLEFMIELQVIRSSWLINFFIMFYLAHMINVWLAQPIRQNLRLAVGLGLLLALPRLVLMIIPLEHPTPYSLFVDFSTYEGMLVRWLVAGAIGALLAITYWFTAKSADLSLPKAYRWWLVGVTALFVLPQFLPNPVPVSQTSLNHDWHDTLVWIEANTPQTARFVTPPTLDGFHVVAKRTHLGNWKDGTVGIFNNGWAIKWYYLMLDLGLNEDEFSFRSLNRSDLCRLTDTYKLDYAVVFRAWQVGGTKPLYDNPHFEVIRMTDMECEPH